MASAAGYMPAQTMDINARDVNAARVELNEYKKLMHQHTVNLMRQSTRQTTGSSSNAAPLRNDSSTDSNSSSSSIDSTGS